MIIICHIFEDLLCAFGCAKWLSSFHLMRGSVATWKEDGSGDRGKGLSPSITTSAPCALIFSFVKCVPHRTSIQNHSFFVNKLIIIWQALWIMPDILQVFINVGYAITCNTHKVFYR